MQQSSIPDKLYFKIGEVSDLVGVKPYVLRYWESEFKEITPVKSRTNQRLYKRRDVELILAIRDLLYGKCFTINGARQHLKEEKSQKRFKGDVADTQLDFNLKNNHDEKDVVLQNTAKLATIKKNINQLILEMKNSLES